MTSDFMASVALVLWYLLKETADSINKTAFNVRTIYSVRCHETWPMLAVVVRLVELFKSV